MHGLPERLVLPPLKGQCGTETAHYVVVSGHVLSGAWRLLVDLLIFDGLWPVTILIPLFRRLLCVLGEGRLNGGFKFLGWALFIMFAVPVHVWTFFKRGMGIPAYPGLCCSSCALCMCAWHGCIVSLFPVHARPEGPRGHGVDGS